jgi:hypothetical protein
MTDPAALITADHQSQLQLVVHPGFQQPIVGGDRPQQLSQASMSRNTTVPLPS